MTHHEHIFRIQKYAVHDGPGIRTTLFFQGCPLACHWCHNPESQAMPPSLDEKALHRTAGNLMTEIKKDNIFYEESNGGVTFSGGEPLCQPQLLHALLYLRLTHHIHTCIDTSGYADGKTLLAAAAKTDLILYDIKLISDDLNKKFTGRSVFPVLENLKLLSKHKIPVWLRFPLISSVTDCNGNIENILEFTLKHTVYRDVNILPFHKTGERKYDALKIKNKMKNTPVPTKESVESVRQQFESKGFSVTIGG